MGKGHGPHCGVRPRASPPERGLDLETVSSSGEAACPPDAASPVLTFLFFFSSAGPPPLRPAPPVVGSVPRPAPSRSPQPPAEIIRTAGVRSVYQAGATVASSAMTTQAAVIPATGPAGTTTGAPLTIC